MRIVSIGIHQVAGHHAPESRSRWQRNAGRDRSGIAVAITTESWSPSTGIRTLARKKRMTILNRLKYAFVMNVIFVGVGVVIAMIFSLDIGEVLFSGKVFYPLLAISFLAAPLLEKHLKFK